jgi:hypothetical protein
MKRCPSCTRVLPDDAMVICPYDGTPLFDTVGNSNAFANTIKPKSPESEQALDPSLEKAARIAREIEYRQKLRTLLYSGEGLRLANEEMQHMFSYVKGKAEQINQNYPTLNIEFRRNTRSEATVSNPTHVIIISWQVLYSNTLFDSSLQIVERKRSWPYPKESDELNRMGFDFHMDDELKICWKERRDNRCVPTEKLGHECIDRLLHLISTNKQ